MFVLCVCYGGPTAPEQPHGVIGKALREPGRLLRSTNPRIRTPWTWTIVARHVGVWYGPAAPPTKAQRTGRRSQVNQRNAFFSDPPNPSQNALFVIAFFVVLAFISTVGEPPPQRELVLSGAGEGKEEPPPTTPFPSLSRLSTTKRFARAAIMGRASLPPGPRPIRAGTGSGTGLARPSGGGRIRSCRRGGKAGPGSVFGRCRARKRCRRGWDGQSRSGARAAGASSRSPAAARRGTDRGRGDARGRG